MRKTIADPLFLFFVALLFLQIKRLFTGRRRRRTPFAHSIVYFIITAGLALLGTHAVESMLIGHLSSQYPIPAAEEIQQVDVLIVLSGGMVAAYDTSTTPDAGTYDQPDAWTTARVRQGARAFEQSQARVFVVSGRLGSAQPDKLVRAMASFAQELGVPAERIALEPNARNTMQHPLELKQLGIVRENDIVGVVTSAWHLPRAIAEFEKHFSRVVAIPAYDTAIYEKRGILAWLPRSRSLASSTTAITEYIGMLWYRISS